MPVEPLLEISGLDVSFVTRNGILPAVRDVSLRIEAGEAIGLVGESGSGKTMTAMSIMRLLPGNCAVGGSVRFGGRNLLELPERSLRQLRGSQIALVSQNALVAFNPMVTVGHQITEQIRAHQKVSRQEAADKAVALLEMTGLPDPRERFGQYPHEFSGGMLQRALIAMALSCDPGLLVADEPTTALDVSIQRQIVLLLDDLRRQLGMGLLLVTHDLGLLAGVVDRVYVMYAGRIVEEGPVEDIYYRPHHPYTQALLEAVPHTGGKAHQSLRPIPGLPVNAAEAPSGCAFRTRCTEAFDKCAEMPPWVQTSPGARSACWLADPALLTTTGQAAR
ncbi:MAG TPA: ABC transporter ATP-binding protein [Cellulomonas sp.]